MGLFGKAPENIICPNCKRSIVSDSNYCNYCGHGITVMKRYICEGTIAKGAKACNLCGMPVPSKPV